MSQEWIAIIVLFLLVVGISVGAALRLLPWRDWAIAWVGNNPERALVRIRIGGNYERVEGFRVYAGSLGSLYRYEWSGRNFCVGVDPEIPEEYEYGRLVIDVEDGSFLARDRFNRVYPASAEIASALIDAQLGVQVLHEIKVRGSGLVLSGRLMGYGLIVLGAVGGLIYLAYEQGWLGAAQGGA